ncbi:MAG: hypothetical protein HY362_01440 [Candidatus Aenigmarchaeota archaeon]|nr:hypothetical protein [Candidatus Aenigmarchaeota archaeon]
MEGTEVPVSNYLKVAYRLADLAKQHWWILALLFIICFSYSIRAANLDPNKLLSFDPVFEYRYTKYVADYGELPKWDELTYTPGREITINSAPPIMFYLSALIYWILKNFGFTLLSTASLLSALYGAAIVIPAFFLGRELSNKYGGLISAALIGSAPQILIRTFGGSYDTDQLVVFFILLTLFSVIYAMKRKTIFSYCFAAASFVGFMLMWTTFFYVIFIAAIAIPVFFIISLISGVFGKSIQGSVKETTMLIVSILVIIASILIFGIISKVDIIGAFVSLLGWAQKPEALIVNISIAELQNVNLMEIGNWLVAFGRVVTGDGIIDITIFILMLIFIAGSFVMSIKRKEFVNSAFLITLVSVGIYTTTRGARFTEFSSIFILITVAAGTGYLIDYFWSRQKGSENAGRTLMAVLCSGLVLFLAATTMFIGLQLSIGLGPDHSGNWDAAWKFLKEKTPENALVGTWWDPGHMITGLGERRVIADGAHCGNESCLYGINQRISDLGKVFLETDENKAIDILKKYKGTSDTAYWIASDDLIQKFQWLQYFGTGCDGRTGDPKCEMYMYVPQTSAKYTADGKMGMRIYDLPEPSGTPNKEIIVLHGSVPLVLYREGNNAVFFSHVIYRNDTGLTDFSIKDEELKNLIPVVSPITSQLGINIVNQTIPRAIWAEDNYGYLVMIPDILEDSMFTRMFFLDGFGLEKFKLVFRNSQVKIYEVKF